MKNVLIIVLLIALGVSVFTCRSFVGRNAPLEVRDTITLIVRDTVVHERVKWKTRYVTRIDTLYHTITDTLGDTTIVRVPVPISQHLFTDYETYKCLVSGYGVSMDMMETYQQTVFRDIVVTKTPRPKRWGLGVQVGYGITTSGDVKPYLGVGLSYNLVRF